MKLWKYKKSENKLSVSEKNPLLAQLLAIRNISTDEEVEIFLHPEKNDYLPFSVFKDSEKVILRIKSAIEKNEKIVVYGDFDTDGVTSTAILYKTLVKLGANVDYYLPDRDSESHGLNNKAIITLISKKKAKLIITVDCGISNTAEVKLAKSFKTDVIVTDHHEAPEFLPEAFGIINPKAKNALSDEISASEINSLCFLSGAGISFKLASALLKEYNFNEYINELEPIAALGTIGDIVPLIGENRRIAYCGINAIKDKINKGITKLFENAGIKDFLKINSETVAFTAVPRINATGRLEKADIAFKLLISEDDDEIEQITQKLNEINVLRQEMCEEAFQRAEKIVQAEPDLYKHAIVICDEEAHVGIIGLSASKLVEKYAKPAFVMKKDENIYRCSCRGLQGVNIFEILNENSELFLGFGGHEFAGGFSFDGEKISFEKVRDAIINTVIEQTNGEVLPNILDIDLKLSPVYINEELVETVKMLEPFGAANPSPVFSIENLKVADIRFMGQNKNHLKLFCKSEQGEYLECVKWFTDCFDGNNNDRINIAFNPEINEFNGKRTVQLLLKDFQLPDLLKEEENNINNVKIIDCRTQKGGYDKIADFLQKTSKKVAVFAENHTLIDLCKKDGIQEKYIFNRYTIPQKLNMVILAEQPPSLKFLKNLKENEINEILLMNYEMPVDNAVVVLSKLAGMLKYTFNSLNGNTTFSELGFALNLEEEIISIGVQLFQEENMIESKITENEIKIEKFNSILKEKLQNNSLYEKFAKMYSEYYSHCEKINNLPLDKLKQYILS